MNYRKILWPILNESFIRYLCPFIWLVTDDPQASELAKEIFLNNNNELLLSAVTGFEIAVKYSLGKLQIPLLSADQQLSAYAIERLW